MPTTGQTPWTTAIALRLRRHAVLKMVGISTGMALFFAGYFHLLRYPPHTVMLMPQTALDSWIPFQPAALWAYLSLWVYVSLAPGLQWSLHDLLRCGRWIGALCLTGLVCFYVWPTAVTPRSFDAAGQVGFSMLQGVDAAGNACPSMHVAAALFSMLWIDHALRAVRAPAWVRVSNGVWLAAIVYSTLAIKQHVVLDVLAGAGLGGMFGAASLCGRVSPWRQGLGGASESAPQG